LSIDYLPWGAQNLGLQDPGEVELDRGLGIFFEPDQLVALKAILNQLFASGDKPESVLTNRPLLQDALESEILTLLLAAATEASPTKAVSLRNRERALSRALEFIAAHPRRH